MASRHVPARRFDRLVAELAVEEVARLAVAQVVDDGIDREAHRIRTWRRSRGPVTIVPTTPGMGLRRAEPVCYSLLSIIACQKPSYLQDFYT